MPLLFSYGTLREADVQRSTFGRLLEGWPDELVGFELTVFRVADPEFVAKSGRADHAMVRESGSDADRIRGVVFDVTDDELARADHYEPAGYKRVRARVASGKEVWVYVDAGGVT